jgi:hypothetical protein
MKSKYAFITALENTMKQAEIDLCWAIRSRDKHGASICALVRQELIQDIKKVK